MESENGNPQFPANFPQPPLNQTPAPIIQPPKSRKPLFILVVFLVVIFLGIGGYFLGVKTKILPLPTLFSEDKQTQEYIEKTRPTIENFATEFASFRTDNFLAATNITSNIDEAKQLVVKHKVDLANTKQKIARLENQYIILKSPSKMVAVDVRIKEAFSLAKSVLSRYEESLVLRENVMLSYGDLLTLVNQFIELLQKGSTNTELTVQANKVKTQASNSIVKMKQLQVPQDDKEEYQLKLDALVAIENTFTKINDLITTGNTNSIVPELENFISLNEVRNNQVNVAISTYTKDSSTTKDILQLEGLLQTIQSELVYTQPQTKTTYSGALPENYYILTIPITSRENELASDFTLLNVNKDGSKSEEIYKGRVGYWYTVTIVPPKSSPDRKYIYLTNFGILNLEKKTLANTIKSTHASCVWFEDSTGLACVEFTEVTGKPTQYAITRINVDGTKKIIEEAQVDYKSGYVNSTKEQFFAMALGPIGIRNQNELILANAGSSGFIKFDMQTKQFDWLYKISDHERDRTTSWVVYSHALDKIYYLSLADRQEQYGLTSEQRYLNRLISIDANTRTAQALWSKVGFYINPENLILAKDQKKLVYQTGRDADDYTYTYYIFDATSNKMTEIPYTYGENGIPKLLGFTYDEVGVVVMLQNLISPTIGYLYKGDKELKTLLELKCNVGNSTQPLQELAVCGLNYVLVQ